MRPGKLITPLIVALFLTGNLSGQYDLNGFAPVDPEIRTGKLPNGLTYYIRKNKEPEKRASFYIIQNVGAILENDDQNGLAHFLEHMAFNGTKNFPGKAIINGLEKHGVKYGANINAYTWFDETVYNLSNVPVEERPDLIDTSLLILHDWSDFISLTDKEIDLERGVINEEWRTYKDASARMFTKVISEVLKGSKYAVRDVIGSMDVIRNFPYNTLRNFYHDWYRTDLQAVVVVGDINVDEVEARIIRYFSEIPAVEDPLPRYYSEIPWHKDTYYVLATDKEAPQTQVSVVALHKDTPTDQKNLRYLRDTYVISLMNSMINTRISELLQKGNPPFANGSISYGSYYPRGYNAFTISAVARKNEEPLALEAVYTEAERARRHGFTSGELERAKARMLTETENTLKQKDKISNDTYVSWIQDHFLLGEPLTSIDFDYEYLKQVIGGITTEEVSEKFRELMIEENRTIIVQGIESDGITHISEKESLAILDRIKNSPVDPYADNILAESLIKDELSGSRIIRTTPLPQFDAIEWTLSNNIKIVYRKADYEKDNVLLTAFSYGGISKLDDDYVLAANLVPTFISFYGAGDYDNVTLQKMLSGKKASLTMGLSETVDQISGSSTPGDFETLLQLLYLRLAKPRFDKEAHEAIIKRYTALLENMEKNPDKMMNDSILLITTGYNPRTPLENKEAISKISVDYIQKIYNDRFCAADEFTFFIVGNIEQDSVIPLIEKYIGSLPVKGRTETWVDRGIEMPDGKLTREITFPLTIPKSTVYIFFEKENFKYEPYTYIGLSVIKDILNLVYTEKVREEEGGTYSVGVTFSGQLRPRQTGEGYIYFDCDPARASELKSIIYNELNNLVKKGPDSENLEKTVKNILKTREESKLHNNYWLSTLTRYYSYGINSDDPENYEDILNSYTVRDIKKIAGRFFKKADIIDLVFKPE
jgi:zinc protease